ncbi:DUF4352 domain-containing protein [Streptomyces sp. NPDC006274]|uniref:DUF4352 domain-containing protein n=1 Tax=unclassified Streptomyces TaxID=2593676 RepID=UPI0033BB4F1A
MRHKATALLPVLLLGLTACQSTTAGPEPVPGPHGTARAAAAPAGFGDAADIGGARFGEHLRITPHGLVDPAVAVEATSRPAAGHRWVGVEVTLANIGGAAHASPLTEAWVVDDRGRRYPAVSAGEITTGLPLAVDEALPVGEHRAGWLAFELPYDTRAVRLHCTVGADERSWRL